MTIEQLIRVYFETHPTNNVNCDGEHCQCSTGLVRIIPLDNSSNVNLCETCYNVELSFNQDRELEGLERILPELPWSIYPVNLG